MKRSSPWLILAALSAPGLSARAQDECAPDEPEPSVERLLRAVSLDLRGDLPTLDELQSVEGHDAVPDELIDAWLATPEFAARVVRLHHDLLWNNVTNVNLMNYRSRLQKTPDDIYWRRAQAVDYRGRDVPCLDEPATFGPDGRPEQTLQDDGTFLEGWVWVEPYWYPGTEVKVCALDAQDALVTAAGTRCDSSDGYADLDCGCGPNLQWCAGYGNPDPVLVAMGEDIDRRVAAIVQDDDSYLDLFTGRDAWINGPLAFFLRNQTGFPANVRTTPLPMPSEQVPDLGYTDEDTWVQVQLDDEHAGILTSPAYLLRFQTNRARANRFFNAFLCQPFQPPAGGLPAPGDGVPVLDLQQRDGCKYCHGLLEPAAAYWGRWTPAGAGYLDPNEFPPYREDCALCAHNGSSCSFECRQYYVLSAITSEEDPYLGWLKSYEFRREEHVTHIEDGPARLALESVVDGRLPACVASRALGWLTGHEPTAEERPFVDELAADFASSGWSYQALVGEIVRSDLYRRMR